MKTYTIPHTDLKVSRIAYGCASFGWHQLERFVELTRLAAAEGFHFLTAADEARIVHTAFDHGITFFDKRQREEYVRSVAGMILIQEANRRRSVFSALNEIIGRLSEAPGQRIIALVSDGFSLQSGGGGIDTSDLRQVTSRAVKSGVLVYSIYAPGLSRPFLCLAEGSEFDNQNILNSISRDL